MASFLKEGICKAVFEEKNGPIPASFCLFSSFSHYNFNNTTWKKLRLCTWDLNPRPQEEGADKTTELWRPPVCKAVCLVITIQFYDITWSSVRLVSSFGNFVSRQKAKMSLPVWPTRPHQSAKPDCHNLTTKQNLTYVQCWAIFIIWVPYKLLIETTNRSLKKLIDLL